jgi:KUP system potassium uptake protein
VLLGIVGAALFFGDSLITPAISVLSAVEGLELLDPSLSRFVMPGAMVLIIALFAIQRRGTAVVGAWFGPVMLVWFTAIGLCGLLGVLENPSVLRALSPTYALQFFRADGLTAFLALGGVVLAVTGAEALYADLGHLGASPIRRAWLVVVFPALVLNYLGQGSLILRDPAAAANPFFELVPRSLLLPMVLLATIATVIASQAVISGAFSLARQATRLGYLPSLEIRQTSTSDPGQVYVPLINAMLMLGVLLLVATFESSARLAAAYGIAVTGTMLITGVLFFTRVLGRARHHRVLILAVAAAILRSTSRSWRQTPSRCPGAAGCPCSSLQSRSASWPTGIPFTAASIVAAVRSRARCASTSSTLRTWDARCTASRAPRSSSPVPATPQRRRSARSWNAFTPCMNSRSS